MKWNKIVYLGLLFGLFSCEKEIVHHETVEKEFHWQQEGFFKYRNDYYHSSYSDAKLFVVSSPSGFTWMNLETGEKESYLLTHADVLNYKYSYAPYYAAHFFPKHDEIGYVKFSSFSNPFNDVKSVKISELDEDFESLHMVEADRGYGAPVNTLGQILVPYHTKEGRLRFQLISVENLPHPDYPELAKSLAVTTTKQLELPITSENDLQYVNTLDDAFYVSTMSKTFRIDSNGEVKMVLEGLLADIWAFEGKYMGVGYKDGPVWFDSQNAGTTWTVQADIPWEYTDYGYSVIDDRMGAFVNDALYELKIEGKELHMEPLENEGLEGLPINGLNLHGDKVLVTSLFGVYQVPKEKFFTLLDAETTEP